MPLREALMAEFTAAAEPAPREPTWLRNWMATAPYTPTPAPVPASMFVSAVVMTVLCWVVRVLPLGPELSLLQATARTARAAIAARRLVTERTSVLLEWGNA